MAGNDCAGSIQVCAMRLSILDGGGVPAPGANNQAVTDTLVTLGWSPEVEAGDEFISKNGCGVDQIGYKDKDSIKRYSMTMELTKPDPEMFYMLVGGTVLLSSPGSLVRGYGAPHLGTKIGGDGVGIEAWSKAITDGAQDPELPWWRWVFPRTYWRPADRSLSNGALATSLVGFLDENQNFYDGPANDIDWPDETDRPWLHFRETSIPDAVCGRQTIAAS